MKPIPDPIKTLMPRAFRLQRLIALSSPIAGTKTKTERRDLAGAGGFPVHAPLIVAGEPLTGERNREKKDGPGPVMVSDTLCPAVHILGT